MSTAVGVKVTLKNRFPGTAACVFRTTDHVDSVINAMNRIAVLLSFFILFSLLLLM